MYIAAYDERNKQILMATAVATLILEFLLIFALIALYAFVNIQLPYVTVLSVLLYGLVLGFAFIRLILSKNRIRAYIILKNSSFVFFFVLSNKFCCIIIKIQINDEKEVDSS